MRVVSWCLLACVLVGVVAVARTDGELVRRATVGILFLASVAWGLAWACWRDASAQRGVRAALLTGAVVLQAVPLASGVSFSDDVWRYVWEGGRVAAGDSPYAVAPADLPAGAVPATWEPVRARVNHPDVPAAYPPATQAYHAALVALAGGPGADEGRRAAFVLRVGAFALGLLVLGLLAFVVAPGRAGPLVAWGWCPWSAFELAGAAHFDVLGVALLVGALVARREVPRHALLALGGLVKFLPLVVVPWTLRDARRRGTALATVALVTAAGWAAAAALEGGLGTGGAGLAEYALRWEAWNLVYAWVEAPLRAGLALDESWHDPRRVGRALVALAFLGWAAWTWRRTREPWAAARGLLAAFLFLTPTLHPWYLLWLLPFLAVRPSLAWGWVLVVAPLAYLPLEGWRTAGVWEVPGWWMPFATVPFLGLLALEARRRTRR